MVQRLRPPGTGIIVVDNQSAKAGEKLWNSDHEAGVGHHQIIVFAIAVRAEDEFGFLLEVARQQALTVPENGLLAGENLEHFLVLAYLFGDQAAPLA